MGKSIRALHRERIVASAPASSTNPSMVVQNRLTESPIALAHEALAGVEFLHARKAP